MHRKIITIISLITIVFGSSLAGAAEKTAIAVLDFKALGVSSSEATFVSEFLRSAIVSSKAFRVMDRANMERILSEQGFQQTGCTTQECAVQVGKLLNVRHILNGNFGRLGNLFQITISVVNVETGEIVYTDSANCESPSDLQAKNQELAERLARDMKIAEEPSEAPAAEEIPVETAAEELPAETAAEVAEEPGQEVIKKEPKPVQKKEAVTKPVEKIAMWLPDDEFEPPAKFEFEKYNPYGRGPQKPAIIAPYYSFQFSEGAAFPAISTTSISSDWFFASSLVNDIGFIIKPSPKHVFLGFYELKYTGPGLERQEGRVFSERTMDHIFFGQYQLGITRRLKLKVIGNYMTEYQRVSSDEEWDTGLYNFERYGWDARGEVKDIIRGFNLSGGVQSNYLNFPNYTDLLEEFQQGEASETIGGKQNQNTYAAVIGLSGKNLKISWKSESQAFEHQSILDFSGQYSTSTLQSDINHALSITARLGGKLSLNPVFVARLKDSNQNYMHYRYVGDTAPDYILDYYDYTNYSLTLGVRWRLSPGFEFFFIPRFDFRNYKYRPPRDADNEFITGQLQQNTSRVYSVGYTRYHNEVSSYSLFYTYVSQASNMKYERYQPYNYTGQYVGMRFNFTF